MRSCLLQKGKVQSSTVKFSIIKNKKELHHQYSRNNLQLYRQWRESQEVHGDMRHQHSNQIWIYSNCLNNANQITLQLYNIYTSSGNIDFPKAYNDSMEWWHCNNFLQASFPDWHGNKLLIRLVLEFGTVSPPLFPEEQPNPFHPHDLLQYSYQTLKVILHTDQRQPASSQIKQISAFPQKSNHVTFPLRSIHVMIWHNDCSVLPSIHHPSYNYKTRKATPPDQNIL